MFVILELVLHFTSETVNSFCSLVALLSRERAASSDCNTFGRHGNHEYYQVKCRQSAHHPDEPTPREYPDAPDHLNADAVTTFPDQFQTL